MSFVNGNHRTTTWKLSIDRQEDHNMLWNQLVSPESSSNNDTGFSRHNASMYVITCYTMSFSDQTGRRLPSTWLVMPFCRCTNTNLWYALLQPSLQQLDCHFVLWPMALSWCIRTGHPIVDDPYSSIGSSKCLNLCISYYPTGWPLSILQHKTL